VARATPPTRGLEIPLARRSQSHLAAHEAKFADVLTLIETAGRRVYEAVNTELVGLYWQLGEHISRKTESAEWGDGVGEKKVSALLTQLPWTHHLAILGHTKLPEERLFYVAAAASPARRRSSPSTRRCFLPRPFFVESFMSSTRSSQPTCRPRPASELEWGGVRGVRCPERQAS
jgi:hypothetical protein